MDVINAKSNTYPFVEVVIYSEILRTNCRMNQSSSHLATIKQRVDNSLNKVVNTVANTRAQYSIYLPVHYRRIKSLLFLDGTPFWDFFAA